jgi:TRAP-type C4-dicarboxylate transport system permease small subunit
VLLRLLDGAMAVLAAALVATTAVVTCLAVFFRSVVGASLPWPEELSGNLLVWTSFAGAYLAARGRGHIAFDLLVNKLPPAGRRVTQSVNDLVLIGFFALLAWLAWRAISVVGGTPLETLPLPRGLFMAAIPVCAMALIVAVAVRLVRRWSAGDAAEDDGTR